MRTAQFFLKFQSYAKGCTGLCIKFKTSGKFPVHDAITNTIVVMWTQCISQSGHDMTETEAEVYSAQVETREPCALMHSRVHRYISDVGIQCYYFLLYGIQHLVICHIPVDSEFCSQMAMYQIDIVRGEICIEMPTS